MHDPMLTPIGYWRSAIGCRSAGKGNEMANFLELQDVSNMFGFSILAHGTTSCNIISILTSMRATTTSKLLFHPTD